MPFRTNNRRNRFPKRPISDRVNPNKSYMIGDNAAEIDDDDHLNYEQDERLLLFQRQNISTIQETHSTHSRAYQIEHRAVVFRRDALLASPRPPPSPACSRVGARRPQNAWKKTKNQPHRKFLSKQKGNPTRNSQMQGKAQLASPLLQC